MKAGLEVHQQLATGKLFCDCPAELSDDVVRTVSRQLRATGGENHTIDPAAAFQASRGLTYRYEATLSSCLVELDEEPPHRLNPEALRVALTMALLMNATPLDEVEVMRKIVVDGSNTAGFQRTALVAVDGSLDVAGKTISIPTICLEEDAARKVSEQAGEVTYRLDRLGIPLIEIATGPEISEGPEARAVAEEIGLLLRSTGRVRRGIGTIREDLNVSTMGGARVEIKGVQDLRRIHQYTSHEVERQEFLLEVTAELRSRGASVPDSPAKEVSQLLGARAEGPIARALRGGGAVLGLGLPGFGGLLKSREGSSERLGREFADYARSAGVKGLLHSDELPSQGIDEFVAQKLRATLGATASNDAFVLVAAPTASVSRAGLEAVRHRARIALDGIPPETRDPLPDGTTRYSRPLPGRDRMYPETDVPPIAITPTLLEEVRSTLPERPELARARLVAEHKLSEELARQIQRSGATDRFLELVKRGHPASGVARILTQDLASLENSLPDWEADRISIETLDALLTAVEWGEFSKEGILPVLTELAKGAPSFEEARARTGLTRLPYVELRALAQQLVDQNAEMVRERGEDSFQPLMGDLMKQVRGRCDGKAVAEALREALADGPAPKGT
ncbi:MAG: Glu-tRNA(Gln) amidotransferase subunit GatE [Thermoplasmata archaeon]|nr:Glu-tRNA(Gln) amidotransferase subunit GatE [Thermoplasmata archaeon]MCI4359324.1 Glu-tRNA(Gln) amidotransferase subunit GatE [Thermoplasmata archaeon]